MKERSPGLCHAFASLSLARTQPHAKEKHVTRTHRSRSQTGVACRSCSWCRGVSALFCHLLFTRELLYFTQAPGNKLFPRYPSGPKPPVWEGGLPVHDCNTFNTWKVRSHTPYFA